MISIDPQPRYPLLRPLALGVGLVALAIAATGLVASLTLLAWAVGLIALATFVASFYLKRDSQ
jgi:hypothetical protein